MNRCKTFTFQRALLLIVAMSLCVTGFCAELTSPTQHIQLPIRHVINGQPLQFHTLANLTTTTAITMTRLEYLVTDIRLGDGCGKWTALPATYFHLSPLEDKSVLEIDVPTTSIFTALAFNVGVPADLNHQDPARWPAGHALNVLECNLHWSWKSGYVFLAAEGTSTTGPASRKPFLYHLGNDEHLMKVEKPLPSGAALQDCELVFHVDRLWSGIEPGGFTHSSAGDPLASILKRNIENAFEIRKREK